MKGLRSKKHNVQAHFISRVFYFYSLSKQNMKDKHSADVSALQTFLGAQAKVITETKRFWWVMITTEPSNARF